MQDAAVGAEAMAEALGRVVKRIHGNDARVCTLHRLSGGASQEIWSFDIEGAGDGQGILPVILRRNPVGIGPQGHEPSMDAEARLLRLAMAGGVPVPEVLYTFDPADGLGSGYLMRRIPGETLARRILRDAEFAHARTVLARQLGAAAARIHALDADAARPLDERSVQGSLDQVRDQYARTRLRKPVVEWTLAWLEDHMPAEITAPSVVHGDMRNGNIMVGEEGLRAVLDWELVHLGDPMADLGWLCVTSWRFGEIDKPVGGLGSREDLFAGYAEASGFMPDADRVRFHEVLGTLRWGLSCTMMARAYQAGDRSVERAAIGRRASETEVDLLSILAPMTGMRHA